MTSFYSTFSHISVDLFDTLIIRRYLDPITLFSRLEKIARKKASNFNGFADARIKAELQARKAKGFKKEVTLEEIYSNKVLTDLFDRQSLSWLLKQELELERLSIYRNEKALRGLQTLREGGVSIIFVTDIYLPKYFIQDILESLNIMRPEDMLYVSSEIGVMKATGELFRYILSDIGISPNDLAHYGDNFEGDVVRPAQIGISSSHYNYTSKSRFEVEANGSDLMELVLGASRCARLSGFYTDKRHQTIWETTANVSAPLMFAFTVWTIMQAIKRGADEIYYFARDGQILYKLAKIIAKRFFPKKLKIKYLYVSRQALLFPSLYNSVEEGFEWIFAPTSILSVEIVLKRINFLPDELEGELEASGLCDYKKHLSESEKNRLKALLLECEQSILQRAKQYRRNLLGYLRQEGFLNSKEAAVVDIGWGGTLQYSISKILDKEGFSVKTHGLYFGVRRRKLWGARDSMTAWFTDHEGRKSDLDSRVYIVPLTELFTMADHGGTVRYDSNGDEFFPVLREQINSVGLEWGVEVQHSAMKVFASILSDMMTKEEVEKLPVDGIPLLERNYEYFILDPTHNEAKIYCSFSDSEDQSESYYLSIGKPYDYEELKKYFSEDYMHHHNEWRQGSLKISNQHLVSYVFRRFQAEQKR